MADRVRHAAVLSPNGMVVFAGGPDTFAFGAARREGSAVHCALADPGVAELLRVARTILAGVPAGQAELLADLRSTGGDPADDVSGGSGG